MGIGHGFWPSSAIAAGEEGADVSRAPAAALCRSMKGPVVWAAIREAAEPVCFLDYGLSPYFLEILFHGNHLLSP